MTDTEHFAHFDNIKIIPYTVQDKNTYKNRCQSNVYRSEIDKFIETLSPIGGMLLPCMDFSCANLTHSTRPFKHNDMDNEAFLQWKWPISDETDIPADTKCIKVDQPVYWGGVLSGHFGHFCSEHMSRVPQYVEHIKTHGGKICFSTPYTGGVFQHPSLREIYDGINTSEDLYRASEQMWDWLNNVCCRTNRPERGKYHSFRYIVDAFKHFGLQSDHFVFIHDKTGIEAESLYVSSQAQFLHSQCLDKQSYSTPEWYINLLTRLDCNHDKMPKKNYVLSRSRLQDEENVFSTLSGNICGAYFVDYILKKYFNFEIVYPELITYEEQINIYRSADKIIFHEGSAIHGTQILGSLDADVLVLTRRFLQHRLDSADYLSNFHDILKSRFKTVKEIGPECNGLLHVHLAPVFRGRPIFAVQLAQAMAIPTNLEQYIRHVVDWILSVSDESCQYPDINEIFKRYNCQEHVYNDVHLWYDKFHRDISTRLDYNEIEKNKNKYL